MKFNNIAATLMIALSSTTVIASSEKGLSIANKIDLYDKGWSNFSAKLKMTLENKEGQKSLRSLKIKSLEVNGDGDKGLISFIKPNDVYGTKFLSFSHVNKADDQWIYMPSIKRIKRISSANKSGPFMGSQFAYEDLSSFEVDKYKYKYIRDEEINGIKCHVLELYPNYKYSGYKKQILWVDNERYIPIKNEYYDRKNELLKTLHYNNYVQYLDKYWRSMSQLMENHQNGKSTHIEMSEYIFLAGFTAKDFSRNRLSR